MASLRVLITAICVAVVLSWTVGSFAMQRTTAPAALVITTEPNATVWIDEIRRGTTDASGKLALTKLSARRHTLRVRAAGFKESTTPLLPGRKVVTVKLVTTTDKAELTFQQAETARDEARDDATREKAADLYRDAIKLRPAYPAAQVGLARLLMDLNQFEKAHSAIDAARRTRPSYAEASAVEGRIYREAAFTEEAIKSFRRSIREGNGFQPEAHVGLARVLEEKGQFAEAVVEYRKAIDQLSDSEPVIYQMLGAAYEKLEKPKEAVSAYEKYLALAPNGSFAAAIRSILDQLKREAAGEQIIP
ncbi:MAG TPA: tetratricopeptide repeat protein [Pyrinomonadaceae bacterium]|jgi:Flp pilus assembly protein TadD|nr:tetratricopeptide repeat protein [Pyrinomonadaceae bacterium]